MEMTACCDVAYAHRKYISTSAKGLDGFRFSMFHQDLVFRLSFPECMSPLTMNFVVLDRQPRESLLLLVIPQIFWGCLQGADLASFFLPEDFRRKYSHN